MQTNNSRTPDPQAAQSPLRLNGVDHSARPTWKLEETVHFYRDILGLPLVHAISARGWGPATHPDFLHFFFDSGNNSTIAFFYYLKQPVPASAERAPAKPWPEDHVFDATHTAWLVENEADLARWRKRLEGFGIEVSVDVAHEVIESIYCRDPNGYFVEFTRKLRDLNTIDAVDAAATIEAGIAVEREAAAKGERIKAIDDVWSRKGQTSSGTNNERGVVTLRIPNVPEFASIIAAARDLPNCEVDISSDGYHRIRSTSPLRFDRRTLGLKPAVWYGVPTGGIVGRITRFDRDTLSIEAG
ncbi:VOC family protein [Acidocella sp.]|uniref:VOC family protein n=1 Tax=Acidocella sp. TaxID=50710 RepID=UPI003D01306D